MSVLVAPLLVFLALGVVGEIHDIATGEGAVSNTIGAVILVLAAIPWSSRPVHNPCLPSAAQSAPSTSQK